jgi:hypothetical protein
MSAFAGCGHYTCIGGGIGFLASFERMVRSLLPASETAEKRSYEQFDHRRTSHAIQRRSAANQRDEIASFHRLALTPRMAD